MIETEKLYDDVITPFKASWIDYDRFRIDEESKRASLFESLDADSKDFVFRNLQEEYRDYCYGLYPQYGYRNLVKCFLDYDAKNTHYISSYDILSIALSWADNNNEVFVSCFLEVIKNFDYATPNADWKSIEHDVNEEIGKLKVYGNEIRCGYLALLHGYVKIREEFGHNNESDKEKYVNYLNSYWSFIKLLYSVFIGRMCDNGHRDFAAIANNMRQREKEFAHIYVAALKERLPNLSNNETIHNNIKNHLTKLQETERITPQEYTLDYLCTIIFDDLKNYLDKNKIKSYEEIARELEDMKKKVDMMNSQVQQMAQSMADAVNRTISIDSIEVEILRLMPGSAYDVFQQLNALLIDNKAWGERASQIKNKIIENQNKQTPKTFNIIKENVGDIHVQGNLNDVHDNKSVNF